MERIDMKKNGSYIDVYQTADTPKAAVVICPGGGYEHLSEREAEPVARKFVEGGYLAVVLWYEVAAPLLGDLPLWQLSDTVISDIR